MMASVFTFGLTAKLSPKAKEDIFDPALPLPPPWEKLTRLCQHVPYKVNSLPADFLAIATQRLVYAKYQDRQILPFCVPSTKKNWIKTPLPNWLSNCHAAQQRLATLVNPPCFPDFVEC
jgi:hypothetical protein